MKLLDLQFAVDNAKNIEMQERVLKHNHTYLLVVTFLGHKEGKKLT